MANVNGKWYRAQDMFYTLMHDGYRKGQETFRNQVTVQVQFDKTVTEDQRNLLMEKIQLALIEIGVPGD